MTDSPVFGNLDLVEELYESFPYSSDFDPDAPNEGPEDAEVPMSEKRAQFDIYERAELVMIQRVVGGASLDEIKAAGLGYVDTDPDPSPKPGARRLRRYWTRGRGAAKIQWGVSGDFRRCVRQLRKYVGPGAEGLCQVYHISATGHPAGKGPHLGKSLPLRLSDSPDLGLIITDEPLPSRDPSAAVLDVGYGFKVLGPDAVPYAAQVIDLKSLGDRADELPVAGTMSHLRGVLALGADKPVTLLVQGAGPEPAFASPVAVEEKGVFHGWTELAEGLQLDPSSLLVVVPGAKPLGEDGHGAVVKSADGHTLHNSETLHNDASVQISDYISSATGHAPGKGPHLGKSEMVADVETKNLVVESDMLRLENLFLSKSLFEGWERVESKGAAYDVGYNILTEQWEAHDAKNFSNVIATADEEAILYKTLNALSQEN